MTQKIKTSALKKAFFKGELDIEQFKAGLEIALHYRGYHIKPGKKPKWSGPFRLTQQEVDKDNAPYFDAGIPVYTYTEQW